MGSCSIRRYPFWHEHLDVDLIVVNRRGLLNDSGAGKSSRAPTTFVA